jgi:hypothetical protein
MIYGRLLEKVTIKKIPLRVWSLTQEIDSTLKHYQELLEKHKDNPEFILPYSPDRIQAFYEKNFQAKQNELPTSGAAPAAPKLTLIKNENPAPPAEALPEAPKAAESPTTQIAEATPVVEVATTDTQQQQPIAPSAPSAPLKPHDYFQDELPNQVDLRRKIERYVGPDHIHPGYAILYDINFEEISFFTEFPFLPGQEIVIEFGIARTFTVQAEVVYIKNFQGRSRLIQAWKPNCRIKAKILAQHPGDRTLLREFLMSVDTKLRTGP